MIGQTVSHYRILEKLGGGGMGVVYKAEDTKLGRTAALKVLPPERVTDPNRRRRFIQEARAASALNHPNITVIHEIDEAEGVHYIAMEHVEGKTLDRLIAHRVLRVNEALKYAVQMAAALTKAHAAGIVHREMDFTTAADEARQIINRWVEKQTQDKIRELIPPRGVTELTRLILANAIYFRGKWIDPFKESATEDAPFKVTPKQEVTVPMMFQQEQFAYLKTSSFQAVRMPYKGGDLSMTVFLPRKVDGLAEFEKSLTAAKLDQWLVDLNWREVKVYLPRFRLEATFTLNPALSALGMKQAFDATAADFTNMTGGKDIFISLVIHKAFVDVDEQGTEAAAATAIGMPLAAPPAKEEPAVFRADHPFLFLIRDQRSGSILFLGRVTNPKS